MADDLHHARVDVLRQEERGAGVAQVVESLAGQFGARDKPLEKHAGVVPILRGAAHGGEDQPVLPGAVRFQRGDRRGWQRDHPPALWEVVGRRNQFTPLGHALGAIAREEYGLGHRWGA